MRRSIVSLFSFLAAALIALTGCQEPQNTVPGSVDSISVRVMDSTDAKTITPDGNVNISHYVITVVNEAEGINQSSGYLTKGSMFTVSNVPAGEWYAKVDAYIDRGEDNYIKVASDQSEPQAVQAGARTTFTLVLETLDAVNSGDVTVTLKMPTVLSAQDAPFWYQYAITGMTDEEFSHTSELLGGTTGADGLATITLDADAVGLMQGAYRFEITVQDAETDPTLTRKGVDVMRLVNGLEAEGTIDLSSYEADQSFDVTVTDTIGDILTPTIEDGQEVYNLDGQSGTGTLTVTLSEPLAASQTIEWYVDGELDGTVNTDEASEGKYTLTFEPGSHTVTAIVRDTGTLMAVGSIKPFKVLLVEADIKAQLFTFSLNSDQKSYTVTGLVQPKGEFVQPDPGVFEIPSTYKELPVTGISRNAFTDRTDITGQLVLPEQLVTIASGSSSSAAFLNCSGLTGDLILPDTLESIGDYAFRYTNISRVENSEGSKLETIGRRAFSNCEKLEHASFVEGLESIGTFAFTESGLVEFIMPDSVTVVAPDGDGGTFYGCKSLTKVHLSEGLTELTGSDYGNGGMFGDCTSLVEINIPEKLEIIGENCFKGCSSYSGVFVVPETVTRIEAGAFGDTNLSAIILHDGISYIDSFVLPSTFEVKSWDPSYTLEWPAAETVIRKNMFNRASISKVNLHDGITEIQNDAFMFFGGDVTTDDEQRLPSGLTKIGSSNSGLLPDRDEANYLKFPGMLEEIGGSNYIDNDNIYVPASIVTVGSAAFGSSIRDQKYQTLYFGADSSVSEAWPDDGDDTWWSGPSYSHTRQTMFWNVPEEEFDAIMDAVYNEGSYTVPEPVISVGGGNATITCDKAFAHIYYTTDGSDPGKANGTLYEAPFAVGSGATVKAVAYVGNGIYSEIVEYSVQ